MDIQAEMALRIVKENSTLSGVPCALGFPLNPNFAVIFCDSPENLRIPKESEEMWYYDKEKPSFRIKNTHRAWFTTIPVIPFKKSLCYNDVVQILNSETG